MLAAKTEYGSASLRALQLDPNGNSAVLTAGIIVADVVGAGILSMGSAVAQMGWLVGGVVMVLMLAMNVHTSIVLWRVYMLHPEAHTLRQLTARVFAGSPEWQVSRAVLTVGTLQQIFLFSMLGLYVLTAAKSLGMMCYDVHWCLPRWVFVVCAIILPIHTSGRRMGHWQGLILVNCVTIFGTIFVPLGWMASQGLEETRPVFEQLQPKMNHTELDTTMHGLSTFAFSMTGQFILVEIMSEMRNPAELPKAYAFISAPFQLLAFAVVGLGGYYFRGSAMRGMIGENIAFGMCFRVSAAFLFVHVLVTYLIKGTVVSRSLYHSFCGYNVDSDDRRVQSMWTMMVLAVLAAAGLAAQIVPFFGDLVDLLGASLTPFCCWVVPIILWLRCGREHGWSIQHIGSFERAVLVAEVVFAAFLTLVGTTVTLMHIASHWSTYGGPFSCHCEGIWATCACSPKHIGMEDTCATAAQ